MIYAVTACNGFGVFNDYSRIEKCSPFLKNLKVVEFEDFYQAYKYAVDYYNEAQQETEDCVDNSFYGNSTDIKPNWILFRNEIRKINAQSYI
ncbi:MAG: hypothetical protein SPF70_12875 [Lachnospiraceae bacterium]|nr:hypothetical protein [Lachnospiraceae bacterium]